MLLIPEPLESHKRHDPEDKAIILLDTWYPVGHVLLVLASELAGFSVVRIREITEDPIFVDYSGPLLQTHRVSRSF